MSQFATRFARRRLRSVLDLGGYLRILREGMPARIAFVRQAPAAV